MPPFVVIVYVGTLVAVIGYAYSLYARRARVRRQWRDSDDD